MTRRFPGLDLNDTFGRATALSSLMVTCALALEAAEDWDDEVRKTASKHIQDSLILGAHVADDLSFTLFDTVAEKSA